MPAAAFEIEVKSRNGRPPDMNKRETIRLETNPIEQTEIVLHVGDQKVTVSAIELIVACECFGRLLVRKP